MYIRYYLFSIQHCPSIVYKSSLRGTSGWFLSLAIVPFQILQNYWFHKHKRKCIKSISSVNLQNKKAQWAKVWCAHEHAIPISISWCQKLGSDPINIRTSLLLSSAGDWGGLQKLVHGTLYFPFLAWSIPVLFTTVLRFLRFLLSGNRFPIYLISWYLLWL